MRFATIKVNGTEKAGIVLKNGVLPIEALNAAKGTAWAEDVMSLIQKQQIPGLTKWYNAGGKEELESIPGLVPSEKVVYGPLYRNPKRIFGIGLNYADHAGDIGSAAPKGFPGSFFKQADTLIGPGDEILLPKLKEAQKTTAEAELGIIMGKDCRDVSEENWQDAIVGYTTILDMTEESILKGNDYVSGNPRYLTIVKNFPTFFSFGPELVTPDEVPDVNELLVQSVHNGEVHAENVVANMTHRPPRLVSLHSSIQGWYAGDILSTGYWGASLAEIKPADTVAVIGAGPTGLCTLMCARLYGPGMVIAIDTSDERLELAKEQGLADVIINPLKQDVEQEIKKLTLGRGADAVLEVAGGRDTFRMAWKIARPNAVVCVVALYEEPQMIPLPDMYGKNLVFKNRRSGRFLL